MNLEPITKLPQWTDIVRTSVRDVAELSLLLDHPVAKLDYPLFLPRPFLERIKKAGPESALWKQFIPHVDEVLKTGGLFDPIADEKHSPVPMIVHRYEKKCLFLPTTTCPVICRYCFRKNELAEKTELFSPRYQQAFDYLKAHQEIEEVILSGGDPLMLSDSKLEELVGKISQIEHIKYLRFHTRFPVIIPERIEAQLLHWLKLIQEKFEKVIFVIHVNHHSELTPEVILALKKLKKTGVEVLTQTVLLKDINDTVEELQLLFKAIITAQALPYYLHHPDDVLGGQHFKLSLQQGSQLYLALKRVLPGWALPRYVIEQPEGAGKVDVLSLLS